MLYHTGIAIDASPEAGSQPFCTVIFVLRAVYNACRHDVSGHYRGNTDSLGRWSSVTFRDYTCMVRRGTVPDGGIMLSDCVYTGTDFHLIVPPTVPQKNIPGGFFLIFLSRYVFLCVHCKRNHAMCAGFRRGKQFIQRDRERVKLP